MEATFTQLSPTEWDVRRRDVDGTRDGTTGSRGFNRDLDCAGDGTAASRGLDCDNNNVVASRGLDFHIRLAHDDYVIDVFESVIGNSEEACLTTHVCDTWQQVVDFCQTYDRSSVN